MEIMNTAKYEDWFQSRINRIIESCEVEAVYGLVNHVDGDVINLNDNLRSQDIYDLFVDTLKTGARLQFEGLNVYMFNYESFVFVFFATDFPHLQTMVNRAIDKLKDEYA